MDNQDEPNDPLSLSLEPYSPNRDERQLPVNPHLLIVPPLSEPSQPSQPPPIHLQAPPVPAPISNPATGVAQGASPHRRPTRRGRGRGRATNNGNDRIMVIVPPFPWSTDRPAKVHKFQHLIENRIVSITGNVQCGSCHRRFEMSYDLVTKFRELRAFIRSRGESMNKRAPRRWKHPVLPRCEHCGAENSIKPIIGSRKNHSINWLFLFLGQLLGCCTLDHLRYFCHYNTIHSSGAKDRVLYLSYTRIMEQLLGIA